MRYNIEILLYNSEKTLKLIYLINDACDEAI